MKKYLISLVRDYTVIISAENEDDAKVLAEFYIGGEKDLSSQRDRKENHFEIDEIEMTTNDAIDVKEYEE